MQMFWRVHGRDCCGQQKLGMYLWSRQADRHVCTCVNGEAGTGHTETTGEAPKKNAIIWQY